MNKIFSIGALLLIAIGGWQIGGIMSKDTLGMALGVLFGLMAGIPAALIALSQAQRNEQRMRHDHYHHVDAERATRPQEPAAIEARPSRYIVVNGDQTELVSSTQPRIEVKR